MYLLRVLLAAFFALPVFVSAQTAVFSRAPVALEAIRGHSSRAVVADYPVVPNIRGIAQNLARDVPAPLVFTLPGQPAWRLDVKRFNPISGFDFNDRNELRLDPRVADTDIHFTAYAVGRGVELTLVAQHGRLTGSLTGALARQHEAWTMVEYQGRPVLREMDMSKVPVPLEERAPPRPKTLPNGIDLSKAIFDGGGTVDVLVLHTDNAVAVAGSQAALNDLIAGSFFDMETALNNSLAFRVRVRNVMPSVLPPGPWTRWNVRQPSRSKTWDARARCRRRSG